MKHYTLVWNLGVTTDIFQFNVKVTIKLYFGGFISFLLPFKLSSSNDSVWLILNGFGYCVFFNVTKNN